MSAPPARPRARRYMRDALTIGTRLRCRRDGTVVEVRQVHRVDKLVECVAEGDVRRFVLAFSEIRRSYELLSEFERGIK